MSVYTMQGYFDQEIWLSQLHVSSSGNSTEQMERMIAQNVHKSSKNCGG